MRKAGAYSGIICSGGKHSLPLARIKKIMKKSNDQVMMISGEAPIVFAKACELFIEDLTKRSFLKASEAKRRTISKQNVTSAIMATDVFDFLITLVSHSN
ncbi:hypothetical protein Leryth_026546 [Lithospermum erythrorhizon]|nr:hypothetical protein Leryth_026546 [Lithospermum erythrorhizon]